MQGRLQPNIQNARPYGSDVYITSQFPYLIHFYHENICKLFLQLSDYALYFPKNIYSHKNTKYQSLFLFWNKWQLLQFDLSVFRSGPHGKHPVSTTKGTGHWAKSFSEKSTLISTWNGCVKISHGQGNCLIQYFISLKLCPLCTKLEQSPSWESNRCQLVKDFLLFYVTRSSIKAFSRTRQLSLSHRPYIKRMPRQLTHWCM